MFCLDWWSLDITWFVLMLFYRLIDLKIQNTEPALLFDDDDDDDFLVQYGHFIFESLIEPYEHSWLYLKNGK